MSYRRWRRAFPTGLTTHDVWFFAGWGIIHFTLAWRSVSGTQFQKEEIHEVKRVHSLSYWW